MRRARASRAGGRRARRVEGDGKDAVLETAPQRRMRGPRRRSSEAPPGRERRQPRRSVSSRSSRLCESVQELLGYESIGSRQFARQICRIQAEAPDRARTGPEYADRPRSRQVTPTRSPGRSSETSPLSLAGQYSIGATPGWHASCQTDIEVIIGISSPRAESSNAAVRHSPHM